MEAQAQSTLLQYGILGLATIIFAYVIVYLYKRSEAKDKANADALAKLNEERSAERMVAATREAALRAENAVQQQAMRADHEAKQREAVENHAKNLREVRDQAQQREDLVRREYSELMETIAENQAKGSQAVANALDKIYERVISPRVIQR